MWAIILALHAHYNTICTHRAETSVFFKDYLISSSASYSTNITKLLSADPDCNNYLNSLKMMVQQLHDYHKVLLVSCNK